MSVLHMHTSAALMLPCDAEIVRIARARSAYLQPLLIALAFFLALRFVLAFPQSVQGVADRRVVVARPRLAGLGRADHGL